MVSVKLAKPWLQYAIGDTVEVDPMRAQWLKDNGYEAPATVLKVGDADLSDHVVSADLDIVPPGRMVSPRTRSALMSKLREPITDLEVHPPVVDLPTPNQDPIED